MTEQERAAVAQAEIEAVLKKYGCTMNGSWETVSANMQIRSQQIVIAPLPNWTAPQEPTKE